MKPKGPSQRYESSHGATRSLTAAQKLAEIACERIASRDGSSLPARFWLLPQWAVAYRHQIRHANALLKIYPEETVIRAFRTASRVWSLAAPFFREQLEEHERLRQAEIKRAEAADPIDTNPTVATPRAGVQRGRSVRSRLNKLDGQENAGTGGDTG
jgi:hypothetical protein